jgi:hypothetical protein
MANPAFSAVNFDRNILENFSLFFSYVSGYGNDLLSGNVTVIATNYQLPLQFPPKITKHERPFEMSISKNMGSEPYAVFKVNDGQKVTLEFTYIVEGGYWTGARISTILKRLRSYPMATRATSGFKNTRVVIPRFWLFGGYDEGGNYKDQADKAVFVFENINISFTDTLVADRSGSSGVAYDKVFPLRTNVAIGLTSTVDFLQKDDANTGKDKRKRPVEWQ